MPTFNYQAISATGDVKQGTIEAPNQAEAIRTLQSQGMSPLKVSLPGSLSMQHLLVRRRKASQAQIVLFTQQMATMLNAGLPVERALQLLKRLTEHQGLKGQIDKILADVRDGVPLSSAFEARSGLVTKLYISMLRAGETGGNLGQTLQSLSGYLERSQELRRSLVSALIYPAILLVMAMGSVIALLTLVVPSFAPMFEELGGDMPTITKVVLGTGTLLQDYWWLFLSVLIVGLLVLQYQLVQPPKKLRLDRFMLATGKIGTLLIKIETARFARTLGALLASGVPILRGLTLSAEVVNNTAFASAIQNVAADVKTGKSLADAMDTISYFPDMAQQMLVVGEETGQISDILIRISDTYDKEVKVTMDRLLSLLVPLLILVLSALIGTIIVSILLAILSVNDLFG
ncbi:general secretion pathway protein F [Marinobacter gudaonensis]|uniref:General secretion pathway protein F n=1 Tax=Marinobacter gudaonensis TaxID=375760 RepID=A0A1I6HZS1_9GAMM|nr:type II secretion system F family protein [Marinobacter gudaonensis]SFR59962.1 general secretion pathway protein F [Marinobacter gudaonensis]